MTAIKTNASGAGSLALACVGFIASAPAFAEAPSEPAAASATDPQSSDILIEGERIRHEETPKAVAPLLDTPRSIVVLPAEVIEQTGSTTLADALRTVPGITFGAAEGGNPIGDRPFIRGFDSQGSIYVDGVRDIGSQTREVFAIDQVQIVRGSDSTLGGRGSAGGTINIVTKLPQGRDFYRASASYGNADYKRITADVNQRVSDLVAVRIAGMWHDQDVAGRDAIWQRRWGVAPSITIGVDEPTKLTVSYYHLTSHELPDSGIPYLYTIGNAPGTGEIVTRPALGTVTTIAGVTGYVPRTNFYGLVDRDFRDSTTDQVMLRAQHDFGSVTLRNTTRYNHSWQEYSFLLPDDSQGNVYGTSATPPAAGTAAALRGDVLTGGLVWRRANTRYGYVESITNQTDLYGKFHTGSIEHSFSLGTELAWEQSRRGALVLATGSTVNPRCNTATVARYYCTSLFDPNPYDPWVNYASDTSTVQTPVTRGLPSTQTQNDANTRGLYAFDSITLLPQLILNLGARYDRFSTVSKLPGTAVVSVRRVDELFNWQVGAVFKPMPTVSLYATYATAATPPNSLLSEGREDNALPTTGTPAVIATALDLLKPQKTKTYEAGAKADLMHARLQLTGAVFETKIANARVLDDSNTVAFIGNTRIRGFELGANGTILPGWTVFGGYTFLDGTIENAGFTTVTAPAANGLPAKTTAIPAVSTGRDLPQIARNSFTATTNVTLFDRLQLGGSAIYMDKVIGGYAGTATQDAAGNVSYTKVLTREAPSYWRFDARASVALSPSIELAVNAQNLTDKAYFNQVYASHYASIAAGRTVFGTLNLKF